MNLRSSQPTSNDDFELFHPTNCQVSDDSYSSCPDLEDTWIVPLGMFYIWILPGSANHMLCHSTRARFFALVFGRMGSLKASYQS